MEEQGCTYVAINSMYRDTMSLYPDFTAKEWVLLGHLKLILGSRKQDDDGFTYDFTAHDGLRYHIVNHGWLRETLAPFGLGNEKTLQRSLNLIMEADPPLLKKAYKDTHTVVKIVGYRFTDFGDDALFHDAKRPRSTDVRKYIEELNPIQDKEIKEKVPVGTSKVPEDSNTFIFPDWFDEQWERLKVKFPKINQYFRGDVSKPNTYATSFVVSVCSLCNGSFYETAGKFIKNKSSPVPAGLTPEKIVDAILLLPDDVFITNPQQAIIVIIKRHGDITKCYSPLLKYWEKNGVAGSSTRSQATSPATKPVTKSSGKSVRSNVQYTAEDYKSNRKVMYTYDYIKSYLPNGMVGEMVHGDVSDYWLDKNKFVKKYDNRITNFCLDMQEAYADAGKRRPSMSNVLDTLVDMAQFKAKEGGQKWEDLFWEYIDQMPVYQDNGLWKWFVTRYEDRYGEGQSNCDMYKGNTARKQAMENDAQFRAIEQTARELIGEDY